MARASGGGGSVRSRLAADADAQYKKISSTLIEALDSAKKTWAYCPDCRKKVQVDFPDHGARLKAAEMLLEQGFGRVGADSTHREVNYSEVTSRALESMSMADLARLGGFQVDEFGAPVFDSESGEVEAGGG